MDPVAQVDPIAEAATVLVARFAVPLQHTREQQKTEGKPSTPSLENLVLDSLKVGGEVFLNQKRIFSMLPGIIKEMISRKCGEQWWQPPFVNVLVSSRTRHLYLCLRPVCSRSPCPIHDGWYGSSAGWSQQHTELLCSKIGRECKDSLRSLEVESVRETGFYTLPHKCSQTDLTAAQLCSLLPQLRGLTQLQLWGVFEAREVEQIISSLASNPGIKNLRVPILNSASLVSIAESWPELETLEMRTALYNSTCLAAVLTKLKCLRVLSDANDGYDKTLLRAMLLVAREHDPASPPYPLQIKRQIEFSQLLTEQDGSMVVRQLLTAYPAAFNNVLLKNQSEITAFRSALEEFSDISVTKLDISVPSSTLRPDILGSLLALVGPSLQNLKIRCSINEEENESTPTPDVDLTMIGHYCPNLQEICTYNVIPVASDAFEVSELYFSKLQRCVLHHWRVVTRLPDPLAYRLFASPDLKTISSQVVLISEAVATSLSADQRALSSLSNLQLYHRCASRQVWAELISHSPRLVNLTVRSRLDADEDEEGEHEELKNVLAAFLQQSKLKCVIRQ